MNVSTCSASLKFSIFLRYAKLASYVAAVDKMKYLHLHCSLALNLYFFCRTFSLLSSIDIIFIPLITWQIKFLFISFQFTFIHFLLASSIHNDVILALTREKRALHKEFQISFVMCLFATHSHLLICTTVSFLYSWFFSLSQF